MGLPEKNQKPTIYYFSQKNVQKHTIFWPALPLSTLQIYQTLDVKFDRSGKMTKLEYVLLDSWYNLINDNIDYDLDADLISKDQFK